MEPQQERRRRKCTPRASVSPYGPGNSFPGDSAPPGGRCGSHGAPGSPPPGLQPRRCPAGGARSPPRSPGRGLTWTPPWIAAWTYLEPYLDPSLDPYLDPYLGPGLDPIWTPTWTLT